MRFKPLSNFAKAFIPGISEDGVRWFQRLRDEFPAVRAFSFMSGVHTVGANATLDVTYTVPGIETDDVITVNHGSGAIPVGVGIAGTRVSAKNTIIVRYVNPTAAGKNTVDVACAVLAVRK